ncbi:hypothetical protein SCE1572_47615 [Sorangium cellulosum So0157-2]|uniref:Uncharacterized protein n=1 Tax=Sorangium cellulosum So0157-2 TaxID=1254432 RepID=S4YAZ9_SORCE|nr:hypothetical protein SCE1572_47615 [Sorangium cellulosum So0157-2]
MEKMPSARSMLATLVGCTRIEDSAQSAAPVIWDSASSEGES